MTQLSRLSWSDRRKLAKVLRSAAIGPGSPRQIIAVHAFRTLSKLTEEERYEWVYWYALGDSCQELGFYDDALPACSCCYHLRPDDPRSTYALATAFRQFTQFQPPSNSAALDAALSRLGFTAEESAAAAIHFFTMTLNYVKGKDHDTVRSHIAALHERFPALKPAPSKALLAAPLEYVDKQRP